MRFAAPIASALGALVASAAYAACLLPGGGGGGSAYEVDPPISPQAYTVPAGAIRVTNSAQLISALGSNSTADIVLADGTYDNATPFAICDNSLFAENLLGATLTAGLSVGGNFCSAGGSEIRGINFDVSVPDKTIQSAIIHSWGPGPGNTIIRDSAFDGNDQIWHGAHLLHPAGVVVERVILKNFLDTGMRISDTASVGHIQEGGAVSSIARVWDVDIDRVGRSPGGGTSVSNGTGEMGLWIGNPVTDGVRRIKTRNTSVAGIQAVDNSRGTVFSDLDIDAIGPDMTMGIGFAHEHWSYGNTIRDYQIRAVTGIHCEWSDPEWGGTPACRNLFVGQGVVDGTGITRSVGVSLDEGTFSTTVRGARFVGQTRAGINKYFIEGTNDLLDNDFSGIAPGAVPIREGHLYN